MSKNKMNKIIEKFVNDALSAVVDEHISITSKFNEFSVDIDEYKICVPKWKKYNFNEKSLIDKQFEQYFHSLSDYAKGFTLVTLSLLHEMGHIVTDDELPLNYDRIAEYGRIYSKAKSEEELNRLYFRMHDEKMATWWAVLWLSVKENRNLAREFEDEFYASLAHN